MRHARHVILLLLLIAGAAAAEPPERAARDAEAARFERTMDLARTLLSLSRFDEARTLLREALALRPQDEAAAQTLLEVERALGHDAEALPLYERLLRKQPSDVDLLLGEGDALWQLGRKDEAKQAWARVLPRNPNRPRAARRLFEVYLDRSLNDEAAGVLERRRTRFGESARRLYDEARLALARGRDADALAPLLRALARDDLDTLRPNVEDLLFTLALKLHRTDDVEKALRSRIGP